MLILSIDCAGHGCGVCVWQDGIVVCEVIEAMERGQDQRLMPMILDAMHQAHVTFEQLDRIAVTRGPGSFTGIRIGLAAARGIGLAADKPVIGIDRFSIFHEALKASRRDHLVVINSRRKELYCRFYPASGYAAEPVMMTAEEIAEFMQDKSDVVICGDVQLTKGQVESPFRLREGLGAGQDVHNNPNLEGKQTTQPTPIPSRKDGRGALTAHAVSEPEHITAAKLAARADIQNPEFLPRPLYIRPPDVTMPKSGLAIRAITAEAAPLLAELHAESFGKKKWSLQQIQSSLALDTTRGWGAFDGDTIIGFIICQLIPDQSEVLAFCVKPSYRRRHAGAGLLRAAADAAQDKGSNLYLEVAADNGPALALYEKFGFHRTGLRPRYYNMGQASIDAVLLTLPANQANLRSA